MGKSSHKVCEKKWEEKCLGLGKGRDGSGGKLGGDLGLHPREEDKREASTSTRFLLLTFQRIVPPNQSFHPGLPLSMSTANLLLHPTPCLPPTSPLKHLWLHRPEACCCGITAASQWFPKEPELALWSTVAPFWSAILFCVDRRKVETLKRKSAVSLGVRAGRPLHRLHSFYRVQVCVWWGGGWGG